MDAATISVLGGMVTLIMTIMLTVMIYLDRARRADMAAGFVAIDRRLDRLEERVEGRFDRVDERFGRVDERFGRADKRFDESTGILVDLAKDVGEIKGRLRTSAPTEALPSVD